MVKRKAQRDRGIDGGKFDRLALLLPALADEAGLHQAGMQIEIMRHDGRAQNAEREIEHLVVGENVRCRHETADHRAPIRIGERDLDRKAGRDHAQHRHDERLDPAKAEGLQRQDQEHVRRGEDDADRSGM